jgi:hypothetical protein
LIKALACRANLREELTVEQVQASKQALFFVLSNLINQGINYWAINEQVYGLQPNQFEYNLPVGGVDVLNALYRTMTRPSGSYTTSAGGVVANIYDGDTSTYCQQTSANGNFVVNYGTNNPQYIGSDAASCRMWQAAARRCGITTCKARLMAPHGRLCTQAPT